MAIQPTDNIIIERGGTHYRAPVSQLPSGGGGGSLSGIATITAEAQKGIFEHSESVSAVGVTASSKIILALAPCGDVDENCPELLDIVSFSGSPATDAITITATFSEPTSGPIKLNWSAF